MRLDSDSWHQYIICPKCKSGVRQRLLWAILNSKDWSFNEIIKEKRVIHFAPEKILTNLLEPMAFKYKTADFFAEGYEHAYSNIDYRIDISSMAQIKDNEYDCLIACDVLEHVQNDKLALKEVFRVLDNGGYCIFTVPQKDDLEKTYEDENIIDPKEREKVFGQFDHLRIYGSDFISFMKDAGFESVQIDENDFKKKYAEKFVLYPPILSNHPLATNYRKIFIGKKIR